ncbi:MAG: DUF11 domain-containing protein, partial [Nitrospira sp.]|nr:DUF11 domain-containing protein [Nitrospira sp.]
IASLDDGHHWARIPGTEKVTMASSFFFDEQRNEVLASSYGRGLFKLDLRAADLQISKSSLLKTVIAGNSFEYTVNVTNNGPLDAVNAVLYDNLPDQVVFQSMIVPSGWSCSYNSLTRRITCTKPLVVSRENATFRFRVRVNSTVADGFNITNRTDITTDTLDRYGNNTAVLTLNVAAQADLSISKVAQLITGGIIQYTITVRNNGPSYARNVQVKDPLADSTAYYNHITTQGSCAVDGATVDGATVDCALGDMAPNATARVIIRVKRTKPVFMIENKVIVTSSTHDPNPANNTFTIRVPVYGLSGISMPEDSLGLTLLQTERDFVF